MPKVQKQVEAFFRSLLPAGTFGKQIFVRLSEEDGLVLMAEKGASAFAPMESRPMKGYVVIPESWKEDPAKAKPWVRKSLEWVAEKPPKKRRGD